MTTTTTTKRIGNVIVTTDNEAGTIRIESAVELEPIGINDDELESMARRFSNAAYYFASVVFPTACFSFSGFCLSLLVMTPGDACGAACVAGIATYPVTAVLAIGNE